VRGIGGRDLAGCRELAFYVQRIDAFRSPWVLIFQRYLIIILFERHQLSDIFGDSQHHYASFVIVSKGSGQQGKIVFFLFSSTLK